MMMRSWKSLLALVSILVTDVYSQEPCQGVTCRQGQECRLLADPCTGSRCTLTPTCVDYRLPINDCRHGKPILNRQRDVMVCDRDSDCPTQATCNTDTMDTSATCCWTPANARRTNTGTKTNTDPCSKRNCPSGQVCRLQKVFCITTPCTPLPMCIDSNSVLTSSTSCPVGEPVLDIRRQQPISCSTDGDCPDTTSCYSGVCCLKTDVQSVSVIIKSGKCPPVGQGQAGICVEQCSNDGACLGNMKCCSNGCGHTCMAPFSPPVIKADIKPVSKPGTCPPVNQGQFGICTNECSGDGACTGNMKCCSNGCGHTCMAPLSPPVIKPDIKPVSKPGTCPPVSQGQFGACVEQCSNDGACTGNLKCCSNGCGHTCTAPFSNPVSKPDIKPVSKVGTCPPVNQGQFGICVQQCSVDSACTGNMKCCSNGCGNVCMAPYTKPVTKPGTCPPVSQGQFGICVNQCSNDGACTGNMKCCSNGCGNVCTAPHTATSQRPGSCPADFYWPRSFCGWLAPFCQQDSDCGNGMKCCSTNTCGRKACLVARRTVLCDAFSRYLGLC